MAAKTDYKTIDEYIAGVEATDEVRERLRTLRALVHRVAPGVQERMSWQMPTFYLKGNLVHFAANKHHIGLYPGAEPIVHFEKQLEGYKTTKGGIQLPHAKLLPMELVEDIVRFCVKENMGENG